MTHTVRTTRWPDRDIEVDDAEYLDLTRWGQILPRPEPEQPAVEGHPAEAESIPEPATTESESPRRRPPRP